MSNDNIFDSAVYSNATLHVPNGSLSLYYSAPVWMMFDNIVEDGGSGGDSGIRGDLNGDGIVDVEDVNALINIILKLD